MSFNPLYSSLKGNNPVKTKLEQFSHIQTEKISQGLESSQRSLSSDMLLYQELKRKQLSGANKQNPRYSHVAGFMDFDPKIAATNAHSRSYKRGTNPWFSF